MESEHFKDAELRCHCGCGVNGVTQELLDALEALRHAIGDRPVIVNDAYRCPAHNAAVGGVPASQHVQGRAADIRVPGLSPAELEASARALGAITGLGRADVQGYLHIDVRPRADGQPVAQWCYGADGKQCPYFPPAESA